ncbi:MAG: DUF3048 domain-containing protein [Oscillibacter sp.]|nr:DUF3048 domain-containing protein [Oscillibacter sp.]
MKKRIFAMLLSAALLASLAGCGGKEEAPPDPAPKPVETPETPPPAEPDPAPEPYVPAGTNPLTGLPIEPEYEDNRPIAVMLNNIKAAQPQIGISQADIIYEVPVEGGITRMLGVYQTVEGIGNLGSVRSARPYYLELALGHDALYVHAGGSQQAYSNLRSWKVDHMDGVRGGEDAKIFWRDAERKRNNGYEHSLLTSGENILNYLSQSRLETEHREGYWYVQTFQEDGTPREGAPAEHVTLRFSNYKTGTFDYDAASGRYLVGQYGKPHVDGGNGQQVSAVNVLVLETNISVISGDSEGRLTVRTTGSGAGTYFCGGKAVPIQWSREDRNQPFAYTKKDGSSLALGQGSSYVCIISPKTSSLRYE